MAGHPMPYTWLNRYSWKLSKSQRKKLMISWKTFKKSNSFSLFHVKKTSKTSRKHPVGILSSEKVLIQRLPYFELKYITTQPWLDKCNLLNQPFGCLTMFSTCIVIIFLFQIVAFKMWLNRLDMYANFYWLFSLIIFIK